MKQSLHIEMQAVIKLGFDLRLLRHMDPSEELALDLMHFSLVCSN